MSLRSTNDRLFLPDSLSFTVLDQLMSEPYHLLPSLRLDEMPVTRSQARSAPQRGGRNPRSGQGRGRAPPRAENPSQALPSQINPVRSFTGRQYYTQALSPVSAQRATEGLESNFAVDRVQSYDSGRERYYAFQLRLPVAVRIYEPDDGSARVECSCEAYRFSQSECTHIYVSFPHKPTSGMALMDNSGSLLACTLSLQTCKYRIRKRQCPLRSL